MSLDKHILTPLKSFCQALIRSVMYTAQSSDEYKVPGKIIAGSLTDSLRKLEVGETFLLVSRTIRYASGAAGRAARLMPGRQYRCRSQPNGDVIIYRTK